MESSLFIFESNSTETVAYEDRLPGPVPCVEELSKDYALRLVLGEDCLVGLGYREEGKEAGASEQEKEGFTANVVAMEETETLIEENFSFQQDNGFLTIGGVKLYIEDISGSDAENELGE